MRILMAIAALATACGPKSVNDLRHPVIELLRRTSFCSSGIYVDADGAVWTESGCETQSSGWDHVRDVTAATRTELESKFRAAEADGAPPFSCGVGKSNFYYDAARRGSMNGADQIDITLCPDSLGPSASAFVDAMKAVGPPGW